MSTEQPVHETHLKEIRWLADVLDNHPEVTYVKPHKPYESPTTQKIMHAGHIFPVKEQLSNGSAIHDSLQNTVKENSINPETSVCININQNIVGTDENALVRQVQNFLSSKDIKSSVIESHTKDTFPVLVIDLAQENLHNKLKKIYNDETLPELIKQGKNPIIDPDGNERTPKEVVKKEIKETILQLLEREGKLGIGYNEFQQLLREASAELNKKGTGAQR